MERRSPLGPATRPAVSSGRTAVTADQLLDLCRRFLALVEAEGHLPANLPIGDHLIGVGQFALLAARSYLARARYDRYDRLAVPDAPCYPQIAHQLDAWVRQNIGDHWAMPLDFSCEAMAEHARLQTWTMKPAWLSPPQGPIAERDFSGRISVE